MGDVSVLLNMSGRVVFERANPLMDLVSGHGPLLFYDRLSLERFPFAPEEQEGHVHKLLLDMRNLLEGRRLSASDNGGRIRVIVLLDLVGGFSHQRGVPLSFPAQKARYVLEETRKLFSVDNQLFERLRFMFLFIESDSIDSRQNDFYRSLCVDGFHGFHGDWITKEMMSVNVLRDRMLTALGSPTEDEPLNRGNIRTPYTAFMQEVERHVVSVASVLERAGVGELFSRHIRACCAGLRTIGDVGQLDFDELFLSAVSRVVGLRSPQLAGCTSFVFKLRTGTATERMKDEMVLGSLLQLLITSPTPWPSAFYVVDGKAHEHLLNAEAFSSLKGAVASCLPKLRSDGSLRWPEDKVFSYQEYSAKNNDAVEADSYGVVNDDISQQRTALYDEFCQLRQVPFFFGRRSGDWQWYTNVTDVLDRICAFESEHDRPLYVSQRRITDREMNSKLLEASYLELKVKRDKLLEDRLSVNPMEDLKEFLSGRKAVLDELSGLKEQVKKSMVKLGFALPTFWLSLLACIAVTVCFAFRFFLPGNTDSPIWLLAALGAAGIVGVVAAVVAQRRIAASISAAFSQVDDRLERLRKDQESYVERVNRRIEQQNEADIRRKNLQEIDAKLLLFDCHNLQVELWEKHFSDMDGKLGYMLLLLGDAKPGGSKPVTVHDDDMDISEKPCLPTTVCSLFHSMQTETSQGQKIEPVVCFLKRLDVTTF